MVGGWAELNVHITSLTCRAPGTWLASELAPGPRAPAPCRVGLISTKPSSLFLLLRFPPGARPAPSPARWLSSRRALCSPGTRSEPLGSSPKFLMCLGESRGSALLPTEVGPSRAGRRHPGPWLGISLLPTVGVGRTSHCRWPERRKCFTESVPGVRRSVTWAHCHSYNCDVTANASPWRVSRSYDRSSHTQVPRGYSPPSPSARKCRGRSRMRLVFPIRGVLGHRD